VDVLHHARHELERRAACAQPLLELQQRLARDVKFLESLHVLGGELHGSGALLGHGVDLGEKAVGGAVSDEDGARVLLRLLVCDEVALERREALDRVRPHLPTQRDATHLSEARDELAKASVGVVCEVHEQLAGRGGAHDER